MTSRTIALIAVAILSIVHSRPVGGHTAVVTPVPIASVVTEPQALNPPYLSEMPSVDRVIQAMQTADPRETAQRQLGAFYQLMEIIKTLSGPREFRGFTPDEARSPLCQQGIDALRPYIVATAKLDGNGGFTFPNGRTGTYYLVAQIPYNGLHLVWNLRVDLKPGANSVTLDQRNTTPIDR